MNNLAGIDVSKGKSMVSVLRPFGEVVALPFTVQHTPSELRELANYLKSTLGDTMNRLRKHSTMQGFMSVPSIPN